MTRRWPNFVDPGLRGADTFVAGDQKVFLVTKMRIEGRARDTGAIQQLLHGDIAKILLQGQPVHGVEQQLAGALGPERMAVSAKVGSMRVLQRDRDCLVHPVPLQGVAIGETGTSIPTRQDKMPGFILDTKSNRYGILSVVVLSGAVLQSVPSITSARTTTMNANDTAFAAPPHVPTHLIRQFDLWAELTAQGENAYAWAAELHRSTRRSSGYRAWVSCPAPGYRAVRKTCGASCRIRKPSAARA